MYYFVPMYGVVQVECLEDLRQDSTMDLQFYRNELRWSYLKIVHCRDTTDFAILSVEKLSDMTGQNSTDLFLDR